MSMMISLYNRKLKIIGILFLLIFSGKHLSAMNAKGYFPIEDPPVEIAMWNFNNGSQGWILDHENEERKWRLTSDGEIAYTSTYPCGPFGWWRCNDNITFHSNDRSQFWLVNSLKYNGDFSNVSLVSPNIDLTGFSNVSISFFHHFRGNPNEDDSGHVEVSADNGKTWSVLKSFHQTNGALEDADNFRNITLPVNLNTDAFKIRFLYDNGNHNGYWAIDNIKVTGVPITNCSITEPVEITANFCAGTAQAPIIELTTTKTYASYTWYYNGVQMEDRQGARNRTISTKLAGTYSLVVWDENGCKGTASLTTAEELVENGDFEDDFISGEEPFFTNYQHWSEAYTGGNKLGPEGRYAVDTDAHPYHTAFYGKDHTTGNGKFLIVNGSSQPGKVIWRSVIKNIQPNTRYYFSAWGMNVNPASPAELQFRLNGQLIGIAADLTTADKPTNQGQVNRGNWKQFYMPSWNSGNATEVVLEIVNNNVTAGGNDFGIDDISFGNLDPIAFQIETPEKITICKGHPLKLYSNIHGGRAPVKYTWTKNGEVISREKNPVIRNAELEDAGNYQLTVTDFYGCVPVASITQVTVLDDCHYLDFDGLDDYITVDEKYNFSGPFTIEAWIKPHSLNGARTILSKTDKNNLENGGYSLFLKNGNLGFTVNGRKIIYTNIQINSDKWQHVALIFDGASIKLYLNGNATQAVSFSQAPLPASAPFMVGAIFTSEKAWEPEDLFHGWIEEVRLWKKDLTEEQLHFMMNQRLDNSGQFIKGKEIPLNVPGGLSSSLLWGYYPLRVSEVIHNGQEHTNNHGVVRNKGLEPAEGYLNNMIDTNQENSAPLPYETAYKNGSPAQGSGDWNEHTTWKEPALWKIPGNPGTTGNSMEIVRIHNNFHVTSGKNNLSLLGLLISRSGKLTVTDLSESQNEYNPGKSLKVSQYLSLNGSIRLMGESQLLQGEESVLEEASTGYLERDQQGTASSFNYNYWSSPVSPRGSSNNAPYSVKKVLKNGTDPNKSMPIYFNPQYHYADGNYDRGKALRISSYWLFKYTNFKSNTYSEWLHVGENGEILAGEGFTMKGSSGSAAISDRQNYTFIGKPNNGTISHHVDPGNDYLVGNPYPSALDSQKFILDNIAASGGNRGKNVFNGTLYFWDHFSGHTHYLQRYIGGYAILNLSGGTEAISTDERINANGQHADSSLNPKRFIPVGQAFYVSTQLIPELKEITDITGGEIIFKNSQRIYKTEHQEGDLSIFKSQKKKKEIIKHPDERRKIYLRFDSPEGFHRQILVTEDSKTTGEFDLGYDAPMIENIEEDMYWILHNTGFAIQGVPDFDRDRELPLGIKIQNEGQFSISIDKLENIQDSFEIHLKDTLHSETHDLRKSSFTTTEVNGIFEGRFSLIFPNEEKIEEIPEEEMPLFNLYYLSHKRKVVIENSLLLPVEKAFLYDITGKKLTEYKDLPVAKLIELPVAKRAPGIYILKLLFENQERSLKLIID